MKVKTQSEIKANFEQSTTIVTPRYTSGVAKGNWKDPALEGQALYTEMMSNPAVLARREKGINKVSNEEWKSNATTKGAPIIAARMKLASGKQASNFEPYRSLLEGITLPAKTSDPATNVTNRVTPIAVAFRAKKDEIG